ncbi:hypothetical protein G9A89_019665 [Geosiphon pyriformis]|nr:hypothetical protein G9A89_019665 [Geosiphon pyriformis]
MQREADGSLREFYRWHRRIPSFIQSKKHSNSPKIARKPHREVEVPPISDDSISFGFNNKSNQPNLTVPPFVYDSKKIYEIRNNFEVSFNHDSNFEMNNDSEKILNGENGKSGSSLGNETENNYILTEIGEIVQVNAENWFKLPWNEASQLQSKFPYLVSQRPISSISASQNTWVSSESQTNTCSPPQTSQQLIPFYILPVLGEIHSVNEAYHEWYTGLSGNPSIKSLLNAYGQKWRFANRHRLERRQRLIFEIERREKIFGRDVAIESLEIMRDGKGLNFLIDRVIKGCKR